ncbi:serine/arginine repetitive matrix protein 2-like isoform X2 [Papaver somniferum]|uniref:serine/arginine repetitive matrix protein 2-like isoform X2 n=1 Tax=Papaver somniferum TaxID=3469 RepID=UPI000E6F903E|nr:serine/arginine repetitive matrix protein 2-like isoform X2 [Papaver somniferum]
MEGVINAEAPLDYAAFQIMPTQNRYEAFVCRDRKTEKVASGHLEQLTLELPEVKTAEQGDNFKLQLPENLRGSAWFTKSTLTRFLHIVGAHEKSTICKSLRSEMAQLEEARRFHLELYGQGHKEHPGSGKTDGHSKVAERTVDSQTVPSDATRNELLRAMDLRIAVLKEDFTASFNQAVGAPCSIEQITDLVTFCEHFGAMELRNFLSKYIELGVMDQVGEPQNDQSSGLLDSKNGSEITKLTAQHSSPMNTFKAIKYNASPAKAAQRERQSSTGSEESSNSGDEDQSFSERSRPLVRSGSSRRSASPMRRIQIGKSGSRRAAALTIKSLSYFPARERVSSNRDGTGNSSEDEDSVVQPPEKPESNVRRMSVQAAISLFENKQKDQSLDLQKKKTSAEVSVNTNKAVLRRWSSAMGDSSTQSPSENGNASEEAAQICTDNLESEEAQTSEVKSEQNFLGESLNPINTVEPDYFLGGGGEKRTTYRTTRKADILVIHEDEDTCERVTKSAEWSQRKKAELSQMLKMMENKPVRHRNMATQNSRKQESPNEQRGGFYDHYKQKRDEKLRGENSGKQAQKEEQFKALQDILEQQKAEMASKATNMAGKQSSLLSKPRKTQKSPSPPVKPKKEALKPAVPRKTSTKASPKTSSLPAARKSWPSAPSSKTTVPAPSKTPNGISSTGTTPTRRKSQPTPSPTRTTPKVERPLQQPKSTKSVQSEPKRTLKSQEVKKQQAVSKSEKTTKTKSHLAPADGSSLAPTKPSFYSKVTRKGSVVPLESKPFLRKGTGIGPGVGPGVVKTKASQSEEPSRDSGNLVRNEEEEVVAETPKPMPEQQEEEYAILPVSDVTDLEPEASVHSPQNCEQTENRAEFVAEGDSCKETTDYPVEMQSDEVPTISPNAWVEIEEHQEEMPVSCDNDINPALPVANPTDIAPIRSSSPRIRHSLSQMLQEENGDPEIIEWGNAENPPVMIYHKDAPKGFKKLLQFARKSKGDGNITSWSNPSVFSEGEEDAEESKAASKRNSDALLRKAAIQASFADSINAGNSDKRATDNTPTIHDLLSAAQASRMAEGHMSAAASSSKGRSFFSLSTFRSSKSNETKLR